MINIQHKARKVGNKYQVQVHQGNLQQHTKLKPMQLNGVSPVPNSWRRSVNVPFDGLVFRPDIHDYCRVFPEHALRLCLSIEA
jgi:hypothetical protein